MMKKWFELKKKVMGIETSRADAQREFDFLLVGARKACLIPANCLVKANPLFTKAFDVYFGYGEFALDGTLSEEEEHLYLQAFVVKKGTDVSSVIVEKDGVMYFRDLELGILLGFPPKECHAFSDMEERVLVHYHELHFATEKSRLDESLEYVANTFKIPNWMKTEVFVTQ